MGRFGIILGVFIIGVLTILGVYQWNNLNHPLENEFNAPIKTDTLTKISYQNLLKAEKLVEEGKISEALPLITLHISEMQKRSNDGKKWVDLFLRASLQNEDLSQLFELNEEFPEAFQQNEKASLYIADAYIRSHKNKEYEQVRKSWRGREQFEENWFLLDADYLLLEGKRSDAITLLNSKSFAGHQDTPRLTRLALLYVNDQPKQAWDYINQAYQKDPANTEIRSYRAKLLESFGKTKLAFAEYTAASQADPKNLFLKDQLAQFHLKNNEPVEALKVWEKSLTPSSIDIIWLQAFFWNRVVLPLTFDWHSTTPPDGQLYPLVKYLIDLKKDEFWNSSAFANVPDGAKFLKSEQSTFWLRLLDKLKKGDEKEAVNLLKFNTFSLVSWKPDLEIALKQILTYRMTGSTLFQKDAAHFVNHSLENSKEDKHPFFIQLDELTKNPHSIPSDLEAMLKSPLIFSIAFLAADWMEAALELKTEETIPGNFPDWVSASYTEAIQKVKGNEAALEFATIQKQTSDLSLVLGKLLIAEGNINAAIEHLSNLSKENNNSGIKAASLLSLLFIEKQDYEKAKEVIEAQPHLKEQISGKETLARIALLEGNDDQAYQLYKEIERQSIEAKSFLARKAFDQKDWARAKLLTEELLKEYPTNVILLENLKKISKEAQKSE